MSVTTRGFATATRKQKNSCLDHRSLEMSQNWPKYWRVTAVSSRLLPKAYNLHRARAGSLHHQNRPTSIDGWNSSAARGWHPPHHIRTKQLHRHTPRGLSPSPLCKLKVVQRAKYFHTWGKEQSKVSMVARWLLLLSVYSYSSRFTAV